MNCWRRNQIASYATERPMAGQQIRFDDGEAYERMMGTWSRLVGDIFLDWLAPRPGQRWIDVGCGNGAFTELLIQRCAPVEVHGVDPSEGQLAFARLRPCGALAEFHQGNAEALPFSESRFDTATMALVIFFVSDPAKSVAEMVRVVESGGSVASYAWDILGGGFPLEPIRVELRAIGFEPPLPPRSDVSRMDALLELWSRAGLDAIETRVITVQRTFADFDDFWKTTLSSSFGPFVAKMTPGDVELLKTRTRARLPADSSGGITYEASANAIKGRVSK
jgi:SAM-dependent methyltransferase